MDPPWINGPEYPSELEYIEQQKARIADLERQLANFKIKDIYWTKRGSDLEGQLNLVRVQLKVEESEVAHRERQLVKTDAEVTRLGEKLNRCGELLANEAVECGKLKRQLAEAKTDTGALAAVLGAFRRDSVRLREALEPFVNEFIDWDEKKRGPESNWERQLIRAKEALADDGGQEKSDA